MQLSIFNRARYYVALGDSITIDAYAGGPGRGAASLLYKNRDDDFPEWNGRDLQTKMPGCRLIPLAMDGATSATVRYAQIPRLLEMNVRPDVVTLTMGGNDLIQCWLNDSAAEQALRALKEHGDTILPQLQRLMDGNMPIVLGTIYDPSDGTGDAGRLQLLQWPTAFEWLQRFNETLRRLAAEHGVILADIHARFLGHGLRVGDPTQGEPWPRNPELWYCGTIEPNAYGASQVRACWWEALQGAGFISGDAA